MLTLGLASNFAVDDVGGFDCTEPGSASSAAVLVEDGEVIAAHEEERFNRIPRSRAFPIAAIRACLAQRGVGLADIDAIAHSMDERSADAIVHRMFADARSESPKARELLAMMLTDHVGEGWVVPPSKLHFHAHGRTHAAAAMAHSGFERALVVVLDARGGVYDARHEHGRGPSLTRLFDLPDSMSLDRLFDAVLPMLGCGPLDARLAVAMAAHGDATRFVGLFAEFVELASEGRYVLHVERIAPTLQARAPEQVDARWRRDMAAALQLTAEHLLLHLLAHQRRVTGLDRLCLAGSMAENVVANGRVRSAELFDEVFVHPIAHDAGCALGAALLTSTRLGDAIPRARVQQVAWGTPIAPPDTAAWRGFVEPVAEGLDDVTEWAAEALANGEPVAWLRGRAEFGSHALGHRNVYMDPRAPAASVRLSAALGRNDDHRPAGLVILAEQLHEFIDTSNSSADEFRFMTFSVPITGRVPVPSAMQPDRSARLQTIDDASDPALAGLLRAVGRRTGLAALLSTSFNRAGEPVVDTADDAIATLLTTSITRAVIADVAVRSCKPSRADQLRVRVRLPVGVDVRVERGRAERRSGGARIDLVASWDEGAPVELLPELGGVLLELDDGGRVLGSIVAGLDDAAATPVIDQVFALWRRRLLQLTTTVHGSCETPRRESERA